MGLKKIFFCGVLLVAPVLIASCATDSYRYVPTSTAHRNHGEAIYSEPRKTPKGSVRVLSMGLVDIREKANEETFPAIHIRMAISVQKDSPAWSFDAVDQQVAFPNDGQVQAIMVNSDTNNLPHLTIAPGELKTVDLYFPLPQSQKTPKDLLEFDLHWQLRSGDAPIKEITSFERVQTPSNSVREVYPYEPYPYVVGWGPFWWHSSVRVRIR